MDLKVSRKEQRLQPQGLVEVLIDDVFDIFPIYSDGFDSNLIVDAEILDNADAEQLDRAMFAAVKQRYNDPVEPLDGIQWGEYVLGELPAALILVQLQSAIYAEGASVKFAISPENRGTNFTIGLIKQNAGGGR